VDQRARADHSNAMSKGLQRSLGRTVARLRRAAGFSQEQFAVRVRVHRTYMSEIERGASNVSLDVIERIAKALSITIGELFSQRE
jgi:transcriptional regulator with XRE-family HTH domain